MEVHLLGLEWRGNEVTLPSISRGGTLARFASDRDDDDQKDNHLYNQEDDHDQVLIIRKTIKIAMTIVIIHDDHNHDSTAFSNCMTNSTSPDLPLVYNLADLYDDLSYKLQAPVLRTRPCSIQLDPSA